MDVQVKISISREAISEMAEIFREAINRAAVNQPQGIVSQAVVPQQPASNPVMPAQEPQSTAYSAQIAQATQMPVQVMAGLPNQQFPAAQAPATQQPQPSQVPQAVPQAATAAPPAAVPTASRTYTLDELASAAMLLMDRGMQAQLQDLLAGYGVEALPMLPPEQYGNFATALRGMGAQI